MLPYTSDAETSLLSIAALNPLGFYRSLLYERQLSERSRYIIADEGVANYRLLYSAGEVTLADLIILPPQLTILGLVDDKACEQWTGVLSQQRLGELGRPRA